MDPNLRAEKIYTFLNTEGRNRLILSHSFDDLEIELLDVGLVLSQALENKKQSRFIANIADERLKSIFEANTKSNSKFNKYLGLQNLGILFESELSIDIPQLFSRFSQNNTLFIAWPGEREGDRFFFLSREKGKVISLAGLRYLYI